MTVRLGFAIAAHLEPEILVVDEVLAVGDAEFQKKAIGKMQDVSTNDGRTVLFVSHNMASVKTLCTRGVILKNGYSFASGSIEDMVSKYLSMDDTETALTLKERKIREGNQIASFSNIKMIVNNNGSDRLIPTGAKVAFEIDIEAKNRTTTPIIYLSIYNKEGFQLVHSNTNITLKKGLSLKEGNNKIKCEFELMPLQIGSYFLNLAMNEGDIRLDRIERAFEFEIIENNIYETGKLQGKHQGIVILPNTWNICS
jgi:lipopolysaccharide transport system ATP-binding protein